MAITYVLTDDNSFGFNDPSPADTSLLSILAGDVLTVCFVSVSSTPAGTLTITNSGAALTWVLVADVGGNTRVAIWKAVAGTSENRTVSVSWDSGNNLTWDIYSIVHTGAHQTVPVPAGNVFSGTGATDVSQSITPTASGSALWLVAGDANLTATFAAGANCTGITGGTGSETNVRPTTQPRTDANAFTISETDTGGSVNWVAFEVQAASGSPPLQTMGHCIYVTA